MKHFKVLFLLVALTQFSCKSDPCATKAGFLDSFKEFNTEFEDKKTTLKEENLVQYEERFQDIVNTCYKKFKPEMTLEERQDFWKSGLAFYVSRYDGEFSLDLSDKLDDPFFQYMKGEVMELVKESGMGYLLSLQKVFKDELPKLMELFSSEIESFGKELMDIFNN